ncbi:winged helix-turn-helix domain-containing protein [Pokkaliibacter sp. MBI-7]|uniref:ATP-binding protein n=1 Tax=Pokkaliibacter sp. MBI-7 TaxID=3040600 RepID=UPI002448FC99|nr:winged helix-turn-helix domain-containing protein [Pokkaliibacter sp. MBI-7]MDH2434069.1 winged helix-turn-helix domain-containing protein [Pokkaliibacter sp. MBI-7]
MPRADQSEQTFCFDAFTFHIQRRLVTEQGQPVRLGSRALDILQLLLENAGKVVSKEQLIAYVWPHSIVEDINLRVHIAALRRALHDGEDGRRYIITVPQRGYSFVAAGVRQAEAAGHPSGTDPEQTLIAAPTATHSYSLPVSAAAIEGRDELVEELVQRLLSHRLVTLTGPGGVGKSCTALQVAERVRGVYQQQICMIDFSAGQDPVAVATLLSRQLGLEISGHPHAERQQPRLLIFDNCDSQLNTCADMAESLLKSVSQLSILVTSCEALRIEGEYVQVLQPLPYPSLAKDQQPERLLSFPSVRLLLKRIQARQQDFTLSAANAPLLCDICRRLDGMPLALELAAFHSEAYGVQGLCQLLDEHFAFLRLERRAASGRHQSLQAVVRSGYDNLTELERVCFKRLGVLRTVFTLNVALKVLGSRQLSDACIVEALTGLVAKSMVQVDALGGIARYRLLHATRAFALELLQQTGELAAMQRRYAEVCCQSFRKEAVSKEPSHWQSALLI